MLTIFVGKQIRRTNGNPRLFLPVLKVILVTFFLFSCSCASSRPEGCTEVDKLWTSNLALWRSNGIVDYDMVVQRHRNPMYGHVPFLIKVRNGKNLYLGPARENSGLEMTDGYEAVANVEQMFSTIKQACEKGQNVVVEYDPENGMPKFFGFSNIKDNSDQADGFKVENFVPLVK